MCGIAGVIDAHALPDERARSVAAMCAAMIHRGPDAAGVANRQAATIGMRRLAIFDPANGDQPMHSPDGRFSLVFNGAIYNFRELRDELAAGTGWAFRTQCDTEVLLAAFARWGEGCLARLRGMFAFAVWDAREETLFLARDPFGIKPLYYRHAGAQLTFASEIRGLLASGNCPAEIDPAAVGDYLAWLAVPAPRTIYRQVSSLRPGEAAIYKSGQLSIRPMWTFQTAARDAATPCRSRADFIHELRTRLENSIRAHSAADVPVGAFLSGGLDSAAVVGLMAKNGSSSLKTFSIDFEEPGYSEAAEAAQAARHFGTTHQSSVLTGAKVATEIETLLSSLDQPTGDGLNTYYASAAAHDGGVKVALSGLGGDELFGGYPSFRDVPRIARWLPCWRTVPAPVRGTITRRLAAGDTRQRKLADMLRHARSGHEVSALQRRVFSDTTRGSLLSRDAAAAARGPFHPELAALSAELRGAAGTFEAVSAWELRTYMADVLLRDSDVMSMRHSLELRVPLLDRPLVEWLWAQPAAFKADAQHPKSALFDAVRDIVPPGLATRRKRGFSLPLEIWMKRELRPFLDDVFSDASVAKSGLFAVPAAQQLWRGFLAGHDTREWSRVWSLAVLIAFANRRVPAPAAATSHVAQVSNLPPSNPNPRKEIAPIATPEYRASPIPSPSPRVTAKGTRTLLLAPEIFASEGGIPRILQTYLRALCDLAAANNGSVRLLALNDRTIDADDLHRCGNGAIEEWRVCDRNKLRFVSAALRLSRDCNQIVCGHVAQLPVAWLAQRLNPRLRYFLVAHGIEVWRPFNAAERLALRGAERVLCVSDYTRREVLTHCPLPEGRTVVLPNALDPTFQITARRPLSQCAPVILVVTRLMWDDRYKGVDHMIEAMPAIRTAIPDAQLRIVGRGDDVPRLQSIAQKLGLHAHEAVKFLGYVDDRALQSEMSTCRLFALPSRNEGFGLVFIEAMAHGRPCLAARAGGAPEVITDETGVLVEFGDVAGIARAAIGALRRNWSEAGVLAGARSFGYSFFKDKLGRVLAT